MKLLGCYSLVLILLFPLLSLAQTQPSDEEEEIIYRPPSAANANARMGGGSRSDVKLPTIAALVPEQLGLTSSSKPTLYWYCSEATSLPREFSIIDSDTLETVKRTSMEMPIEAGWQRISLGELGVELKPDTNYEWRIALIASTTRRSDNAVAGGMIRFETAPAPPTEANTPAKRAAAMAEAGLWYDALDALMSQLSSDSTNGPAKKMLASLLRQVKLDEAAAFAAN